MDNRLQQLLGLKQLVATASDPSLPNGLINALQDCINAPRRISEQLVILDENARKATNDMDRQYIEWQMEVLEKRVKIGAKEARRRLKLIENIKTMDQKLAEIERCKASSLYWFENWAWTVDQRENLMPVMPFVLFDFQKDTIRWWEELIFIKSSHGYLDKSRDQGISWLICGLSVKHWLFSNRFDALFGSRTEDLVDASGRLDSLFEKLRFLIRMLPPWMLPEGFEWSKDSNFKRLVNPSTGSVLVGEAPTINFARSGRYLYCVLDELAFWPHGGYQAWGAVSQSSRSNQVITTPAGKNNQAADLKFQSDIAQKSIHWREHPWKDERWYNYQSKTMSRELRAQELDLDYEAAQPGRIFPMWDEVRTVITKTEFCQYFGLETFRIPSTWLRGMALDWGSTSEHRCVALWVARPSEDYKLTDCVFVYRQFMPEVGATPRQVAKNIRLLEAPFREYEKVNAMRLMSHEAKSERDTFIMEHALPFEAWDTDYNAGIAQLQNYLEVRTTIRHPFKPYIQGAPRIFLIVDDEQGKTVVRTDSHEKTAYLITQGEDDRGMARLRAEIPRYHYPASEQGKAVQARRPFKLFDDAIDPLRALAAQFFPRVGEQDQHAQKEKSLSAELKAENIIDSAQKGLTNAEISNLILSREIHLRSREREQQQKPLNWRDQMWANDGQEL